ncbi:E3 ubiquitin ligase [Mortierella alpina]|nr:E3 ubiquitin ligase [Mortierella alpina]
MKATQKQDRALGLGANGAGSAVASSSAHSLSPRNMTTSLPAKPDPVVKPSLDDMALELMMEKEANSEVVELRSEVARLKKEIEFKDKLIARLQAGVHDRELSLIYTSAAKPGPADTVVASKRPQGLDGALQCSICVDYFSSPFTVECGHTFCYACLRSWLEIHKSCPTCRTKLLRRPTLSFNIREQVHASIARLPEPERKIAQEKMAADEQSMQRVQSKGDVWKDIFKPLSLEGIGNTIVDAEDGVRRCASCGWEVRGGVCVNCSNLFSDVEGSDVESQDNTDQESEEPDEYDSHDSFIDDGDSADEYGGSESDSDSNVDPRVPSDDLTSLNTNRSERGSKARRQAQAAGAGPSRTVRRNVVQISDDSDDWNKSDQSESDDNTSEEGSGNESKEDDEDAEEEDEDEDEGETLENVHRKARRQPSRRPFILLSDDDDDERDDRKAASPILVEPAMSPRVKAKKRQVILSDTDSSGSSTAESGSDDENEPSRHRSKKPRGALESLFE